MKKLRNKHPILFCFAVELLFIVALLAAGFGMGFVLSADVWRAGGDVNEVVNRYYYVLGAAQELVAALVALLLLRAAGQNEVLHQKGCGFGKGLFIGLYPLVLISWAGLAMYVSYEGERVLQPLWMILAFAANMVLIGLAEEIVFRGLIARTLLNAFGPGQKGVWGATVLSGVLFGLAHLSNLSAADPLGVFVQVASAGVLGMLLAAIYFRSGNLWVVVFLHAAMDFASLLQGGLYGTSTLTDTISGYTLVNLAPCVVYLIPTVFLLRKKKLGEIALWLETPKVD